MSLSSNKHLKFLKPDDDHFKEDRSDIDTLHQTSFIYNPNHSQPIDRQRQKLPVFKVRSHFLYLMETYQVLLVVGETGSGKSTQLPQYLLESGWCTEGMIGISQPRRISCTSLASRVAKEKGCLLSEEVGYAIRFDDCTTSKTKIKYLTEGLLVREIMADPLLKQYSVIMLDEVHERTLYTDIILGLLKKILKKRENLKLIVSSATLDAETMFNFFNTNKSKNKSEDNVAILSVHGRSFPIHIFYLKEPVPNYIKSCAETALKIHETEPPGSILIFLTGVEEIDECIEIINSQVHNSQKLKDSLLVLPMHGSLSYIDQLKVFQSVHGKLRKIIVSTNIAETSITIPDIAYVIDCGFMKIRWYHSKMYSDALIVIPTSKASAAQRAGRAGRIRSGNVYRMYTENEYKNLSMVTPPEMLRTNLNTAVLNLMALGIDNMARFDFPSAPPSKHLVTALDELFALGAIDANGKLTKPIGEHLSQLPLPPSISKILIRSESFGCSREILSIIAMLQIQNPFIRPYSKLADAKAMHREFEVAEGDLLTLLNVYTAFEESKFSRRFCSQYFLNYQSLKRAQEIRNSISKVYSNYGLKIVSSEGAVDPVCRCICEGLFQNAAYLHFSGYYKSVKGQQILHIHPSSVLYDQKQPQWILYSDLIHTSRVYMKDITVIDKEWLIETAPHFYEKSTLI